MEWKTRWFIASHRVRLERECRSLLMVDAHLCVWEREREREIGQNQKRKIERKEERKKSVGVEISET